MKALFVYIIAPIIVGIVLKLFEKILDGQDDD